MNIRYRRYLPATLYIVLINYCDFCVARHLHRMPRDYRDHGNFNAGHGLHSDRHKPHSRPPNGHNPHSPRHQSYGGLGGHPTGLGNDPAGLLDAAGLDPMNPHTNPLSAAGMAKAAAEANRLGLPREEAAALAGALSPSAGRFGDPNAYGNALAGDVTGGGITGYNLGGANDPKAATSNIFHDPIEAALHETGPFGSQSPLSMNMQANDDPTVQQRIQESLDTVHDDTLKANLAKKQELEAELEGRRKKALEDMAEIIKQNASAAAERDAMAAKLKAAAIAAKAPYGDLNAKVPGTNKTYEDLVQEQLAVADHADTHARNPDLYSLENAAAKTGFPRPTMGKEILDEALREMIKKNLDEAAAAKASELQAEEERKAKNELAAKQVEEEQEMRDAEKRAAEKRAADEVEAVQAAEANDLYAKAAEQAKLAALSAEEAAAANIGTAADVKAKAAEAAALAQKAAAADEAALVAKEAAAGSLLAGNMPAAAEQAELARAASAKADIAKAAADAAAKQAEEARIAQEEAMVAAIGERAAAARDLQKLNMAMADAAAVKATAESQKLAEAAAAGQSAAAIEKALAISPADIAKVGEAAVEKDAIARGAELKHAAAQEAIVAQAARSRGAVLSAAKQREGAIEDSARKKRELLAQAEIAENEAEKEAALKEAALADASAKEIKVAEAARNKEGDLEKEIMKEVAEEAEAEGLADRAGFTTDDPYKILGTIPDDADTVALRNSSIDFPLKTFGAPKAHNQAEAGALAAQNKIKDDLRGKVTADKFDTPLNVIKGEGGYLNIPESAEKIEVESGRVYFPESAVKQMEKDGKDTSKLEHKINTGERADMAIGLGYYVADVGGMAMDVPSPTNPDPPRVIEGSGHTYDISQAQGMDIEKGELKVEKWKEYSRRVRPRVNTYLKANGREQIIDAVIDDDCVKQALKDADAMFNTKSEIITNPSGESYIKVTPAFGVTEQIPVSDAVYNLDRIKQSCRVTHGQLGVSVMQESDLKSAAEEKRRKRAKSLNIAEVTAVPDKKITEEDNIRKIGLEQAANLLETHHIIKKENAFDHKEHPDKLQVVEEGARALEAETGIAKEVIEATESERETQEEVEKAKAEIRKEFKNTLDSENETIKISKKEVQAEEALIRDAADIKMMIVKEAANIATQMNMSEEEVRSLLSKISIAIFKSFINYAKNPSSTRFKTWFESAKSELNVIFGNHTDIITRIIFANISKKFGLSDPDEQVLIKKETTHIPKIVRSITQPNKFGGHTTVFTQKMVPVTRIIRIPIKRIVHTPPNNSPGTVASSNDTINGSNPNNIPVGQIISGKIKNPNSKNSQKNPNSTNVLNSSETLSGPGDLGTLGNKIKLGDNGTILGLNSEIKQLVDPDTIGNITGGDVLDTAEKNNNGITEKGTALPFSARKTEVITKPLTQEECKDCINDSKIQPKKKPKILKSK
ncbi:hypothetical protein EDEG_03869 [Edhazardia aedis USNM 41457]|uniref:Polar tube protein 3 n=1 Tax=Edhazardia aedis (strain USNM 41457) TaxID=1003232 RepID=J9D175_EDHAE|nr:hypothetical protein EDEG_03869 [Edhazardia aedis USNM 41457]|eukprot:EJW01576.1 hypothetical protein EDEG_03869 [Edhazardia aedis USNM 41457]